MRGGGCEAEVGGGRGRSRLLDSRCDSEKGEGGGVGGCEGGG